MGCRRTTAICQHEVDQAAMLVNSAKQVLPLASDLHLRLVHAPAGPSIALIPPRPLLQLTRVPRHPAHDRRRICFHATLLHHLHEMPIADAVLAVPANTKQEDRNGDSPTLKPVPHPTVPNPPDTVSGLGSCNRALLWNRHPTLPHALE